MSVIAITIEPNRVTRIFFDGRDLPPDPAERRRIERAVEDSYSLAEIAEEVRCPVETITNPTSPARLDLVTYRSLWAESLQPSRSRLESDNAELD